ncbi:MAG: hypothetical protein M1816_001507 [Peltula sp. TS41687]|nr:MAG: hypothetical protein M1816_001507 [Peltula sp. TS41687]
MIQELYLSELRRYKPAPIKPSDAEGHVQRFSAPKPPPSPEEGNLARDLKAYEEQQVEVEGQRAQGEEGAEGAAGAEHDWFEDEDGESEEGAEKVTLSGH